MSLPASTCRPFSVKFALVTAAVGAGFAAPAQATVISTAPAGYSTMTFRASAPVTYNIDINTDGLTDFVITTSAVDNAVTVTGTGMNTIAAYNGLANAYSDPSQFLSSSSIKSNVFAVAVGFGSTNLMSNAQYIQLILADQSQGPIGGYLQATAGFSAAANEAIFALYDFGVVTADPAGVPEPGSLALLAAGAAGVGALRRRRRATRAV